MGRDSSLTPRVQTERLRPRENLATVAGSVLAFVMAIAVSSPAGLLVVGVEMLAFSAAVVANAGGFGERAWVTSEWMSHGLSLRLFRIAIGGVGGAIALAGIVAGIVLVAP